MKKPSLKGEIEVKSVKREVRKGKNRNTIFLSKPFSPHASLITFSLPLKSYLIINF